MTLKLLRVFRRCYILLCPLRSVSKRIKNRNSYTVPARIVCILRDKRQAKSTDLL